jgi:D-alanyl-D-alanine dipeptidase
MLLLLAILSLQVWAQENQVLSGKALLAFVHRTPKEFVDLEVVIPTIQLSIGYHGNENFTGQGLPGYGVPKAWLLPEPADALAKVQEELSLEDMSLLVYDAYRPRRASEAMVAWAKRSNRLDLIEQGYIASRSGHNHGHTIDLTLIDLKTGKPLDMGSDWDVFDSSSHFENATGVAMENRKKLRDVMSKHGFRGYSKEWWHFRYPMVGTIARDVPYSCFEVQEWKFKPPSGWDQPGYIPQQELIGDSMGEPLLECRPPF